MITTEQARNFAKQWIKSWNSRDIESVLSHYTEDIEMTTPFISIYTDNSTGTVKGKNYLRKYWETALSNIEDINFEIIDVLTGVNSITIYYKAVLGKKGAEVFFLNNKGQVYRANAHYDSL